MPHKVNAVKGVQKVKVPERKTRIIDWGTSKAPFNGVFNCDNFSYQ
jgi:hypothetical protein